MKPFEVIDDPYVPPEKRPSREAVIAAYERVRAREDAIRTALAAELYARCPNCGADDRGEPHWQWDRRRWWHVVFFRPRTGRYTCRPNHRLDGLAAWI